MVCFTVEELKRAIQTTAYRGNPAVSRATIVSLASVVPIMVAYQGRRHAEYC